MRERPIGATALALASVVVGIYSLVAAIALILGASMGAIVSSDGGTGAFLVGLFSFGLAFAAFFVGSGFWLQTHWAWAGGVAVFATAILLSAAMVLIGSGLVGALVAVIAAGAALVYLVRPSTKAQLLVPVATDASEPAA